jgi:hypothetical protein
MATIRGIVATLQAEAPAEHARIARGVQVLLSSKIVETGTVGRYLVQSTADGLLYYEATSLQAPALAQFLVPLAQELAAARRQLVDQAEMIGRLTAELAVARAQLEARQEQAGDGDLGVSVPGVPRPCKLRF